MVQICLPETTFVVDSVQLMIARVLMILKTHQRQLYLVVKGLERYSRRVLRLGCRTYPSGNLDNLDCKSRCSSCCQGRCWNTNTYHIARSQMRSHCTCSCKHRLTGSYLLLLDVRSKPMPLLSSTDLRQNSTLCFDSSRQILSQPWQEKRS